MVKFRDICTKIGSGATPKGGKEAYCEEGITLIRSQNVLDFSFSETGLAYINDEQADKLKNVIVEDMDVLINITGDSVARTCMVDKKYLPARVNQHVCIVRANQEKVVPSYLLYILQQKKNYLLQMASGGATRNALTKDMICELEVELPSIAEQRKIVAILDDIQEKIKLNAQINNNLEQQISALLIAFIEENSTVLAKLGDYLYIKGRIGWKGLKKNEYLPHSNYRIINGETLTKSGIDWTKAGYISEERYMESPEIMLQIGDILLSKDGTIGKIGYIDSLDFPTSVASGIFVIRNNKPDIISTTFIYFLLRSKLFDAFIAARTEGSVIPHLYQKDFMEFEFPLPNANRMQDFEDITGPMFSQIIENLKENKALATLRDALLPKLMSGELDISELNI